MRWILALAFLVLPAAAAQAQTVSVRAGEHRGFTRVVFYVPRGTGWEVEPADTGYRIGFDRSLTFNGRRLYERIGRERVAGITQDPATGSLSLDLACDCEAEAYQYGNGMFVMDIREASGERPQRPSGRDPLAFALDSQAGTGLSLSLGETIAPPPPPEPEVTAETAAPVPPALPPMPTLLQRPAEPVLAPSLVEQSERAERVRLAEEQLLKQLARAASQGLIQPRSRIPGSKPPPQVAEPAALSPEPPAAAEAAAPAEAVPQLSAQTSMDRDVVLPMTEEGPSKDCVPSEALDIARWPGGEEFATGIAVARSDLFDEAGALSQEGAKQLVQGYLRYGLGVEARQILRLAPGADPDGMYAAMAGIVEDGVGAGMFFAGQFECKGAAPLWAAAEAQTLPPNAPINTKDLLYAFNALPPELRLHLGPPLSRKFLAHGDEATAETLISMAGRGEEAPSVPLSFAKGESALHDGDLKKAEAELEVVIESNSELSPEALSALIGARLDAGEPVDAGSIALAEALISENRDAPVASALRRQVILVHAAAGAYQAGYEALKKASEAGTAALSGPADAVFASLAENAPDDHFLTYAIGGLHLGWGVTPDTSELMARRLLSLGFPAEARTMLRSGAGEISPDGALTDARGAMDLGLWAEALAAIAGLEGEEAARLRAEIHARSGEHALAAAQYESLGDAEAAARQALLAGAVDRLAGASSSPARALAEQLLTDLPQEMAEQALDEDAKLARGRFLLEASAASRAAVRAATSTPSAPES